jgi:hypothetical protein
MGILKRNAIVAWQFLRYSCVYKCAYGSCGSLFYWYTTLSCMRERGGEGVSRKVGGWVQGKMMKEKGRIGKKRYEYECGCGCVCALVHLPLFLFSFPDLVVQV